MQHIKCPQCGGAAIEDHYYKINEFYIYCGQCGYYHTRDSAENFLNGEHKLNERKGRGYGVALISKKNGKSEKIMYATPITEKVIQTFKEELDKAEVIENKSYLIAYEEGFKTILGEPPEEQFFSYEKHKEKQGVNNDNDVD